MYILGILVSIFSLQVLADPPGAPNNGSLNGGYNNGGSGSGGSSGGSTGGNSTGYGGGSSSGTTAGGGATTSGNSTGYGGGNGGNGSNGGGGGLSFGPGIGSAPSPCNGCGQSNLGFGPNIGNGSPATGSNLGYSMGTSVSVGGSTTTSGGSTSGGGSGGNGGTGGLSMGTPVNTTSSVGTVVNSMLMGLGAATGTTAIAQNFAAGLQRVATNIGLPVARVVQQVSRVISVQVAASTAGVVNMNNSIRGTIGAGGLGYQEAVQAAYNRGVQAYYDANSIPQSARMVPTGPMARTYGMAAVARDPAMASIDAAFNQGSVSVVNVETGTSLQHLREFLGPNLYDSLTDQQRVGAQRSVLVGGTLSTGPTATSSLGGLGVNLGEYTPNRSALTGATTYSAPGYVVVDTNRTDYATTMRHELQHAGDYENYEAARQVASDTTSSSVERARAQEVVDRLEPVVSQMVYRNLTRTGLAIAAGMSAAQVADLERRRNYLAQAAEVRAFAVDPTNRRGWVDRYSVVSRVSVEEAEAIFDSIVDQAGILDPNSPEAEFANDLLGGGN